jgi:adenylate cyclase
MNDNAKWAARLEADRSTRPVRVSIDIAPRRDGGPREERRIVTFIDLVDSTAIAERLGSVRYHGLLSDVFACLSLVVTQFGGEVHRYVGDALIATWPLGAAEENARAIRSVFACREALEASSGAFARRHGAVPKFRASIHCGPLVVAEIGGLKRETALVGDAMNTAARIEEACRALGHAVLASRTLLAETAIPDGVVAASIGSHRLRGKSESLELLALQPGAGALGACPPDVRACA